MAAWTYSDYVTSDYGATRLSRFRLHVQEVSDALSAEMAAGGMSRSTHALERYLASLKKTEPDEIRRSKEAAGASVVFTRARMLTR